MTQKLTTTPFLAFWAAVNASLTQRNLPELTFGPAHDLWETTRNHAANTSFRLAMDAAGK